MSEQKTSFMAELDRWTQTTVIDPLADVDPLDNDVDVEEYWLLVESIKKAIREKVLESYRNGQASKSKPATPVNAPARKPWRRQ